jgi:peptidoglycan/xylan/chitin deacetylase (PgdA/CDA1 family)
MLDFMVGPSILMYHSIADNSDDPYTVTISAFREQLFWLTEYGFSVVPLSFLLQSIKTRNYKKLIKKVVITFDDGYKDFVTNALPILLDHRAPATVFLVTDMLGGSASWNELGTNVRLMSEDEVRYIKAQGISLGSHSATHANLTLLDDEDLHRQLRDSHERLSCLGESFYAFSYPWGQWSSQSMNAVKASGYECAVAVGGQMRLTAENTYLLPRITMRGDTSLKSFRLNLTRTPIETEIRRKCRAVLRMGFGTAAKNPYYEKNELEIKG